MRWYWQMLILGAIGGGGYYAHLNWDQVRPVVMPYVPEQVARLFTPPAQPGGGGPRPGGPPGGAAPLVEVVRVGTGNITEITEAVGTTRALESVTVTAKVTGIVASIAFQEGQVMRAGQELLRMDAAERQAELDTARAAIQTSQAQRQEIAQRLERARQLRATGAGTEAQVADLTLQFRTAETNVVAAQARERASQARLDDLIVRAPFAGRVGVRQVSVGALLETRTAITTLDDLTKVRLDFAVPEILLSRLRVGTKVRTQNVAYGQRVFEGEVAVMDTRVDPVTRSVRLTALIENPELLLRPGMFMNVALEVATRPNAVLVPEEALVAEGPRQILFVVADGRIDRRVVLIGQRQGGRVEVTEGVREGETIVARGVQRVRHGMQVTARPVGQPGATPPAGPPRPPGAAPSAAAPAAGTPAPGSTAAGNGTPPTRPAGSTN